MTKTSKNKIIHSYPEDAIKGYLYVQQKHQYL